MQNMTCITFGQPHVSVDLIQAVAKRRPEMVTTINTLFVKEDLIPSLMGLLDESWSQEALQASVLEQHLLTPVQQRQTMVS